MRDRTGLWIAVVFSTSAMALGCAGVGNNFSMSAVPKLVPGRTTEAKAISILGAQPPDRSASMGSYNPATWKEGDYFLSWHYIREGWGDVDKSLVLMFDSRGVLKEIVSRREYKGP